MPVQERIPVDEAAQQVAHKGGLARLALRGQQRPPSRRQQPVHAIGDRLLGFDQKISQAHRNRAVGSAGPFAGEHPAGILADPQLVDLVVDALCVQLGRGSGRVEHPVLVDPLVVAEVVILRRGHATPHSTSRTGGDTTPS